MEGTKPSSQGVPCNRHNSALSSVLPTLVHIYIPQTYTPCGRFIGTRTYSLSWAPTFRGRLVLPFCVLIISQTLRFVKTFFEKNPVLFSRLSPTPLAVGVCAPCEDTGGRTGKHPMGIGLLWRHPLELLFVL
jgi:hypothetical protein